jgi:hypothetical protein
MKELTLMNRYHQTQGRPKPPVEQRVEVMDTLDKKMESILEREDLSTVKRLKLYDQSFTRYLKVHDDYRPRPVVSRVSKYFNPQGWETFGEAIREANVPQDLIGHENRWKYITQTERTPRSRKRQQSPSPIRPYSPKTQRNRRKEVKNWVDF